MALWNKQSLYGAADAPRVLAYCASNVGLGHYGRLVRVLGALKQARPELSILLATDAREQALSEAAGIARLQLPGFAFTGAPEFKERPERLNIGNKQLQALRSAMLRAAAESFEPQLLLMDTNPHGKRDEALGMLKVLRKHDRARVALMMRDIPCPPGESFKLNGATDKVLKHAAWYDRFLVAGDPGHFDLAEAYDWPKSLRKKLCYTGFVVPDVAPAQPEAQRRIVASFGGGWLAEHEALRLLEAFERWAAHQQEPIGLTLVTGPAMSPEAFEALARRAAVLEGVEVAMFLEDFPARLACADLAILQAGSTVFQILESDVPVVLIVRDYKSREQHARAECLARWPGVSVHEAGEECTLNWDAILAGAASVTRTPRETGFGYDGVARASEACLALLDEVDKL